MLGSGKIRVPYTDIPICVELIREGVVFCIHAEELIATQDDRPQKHFLLFNPDHFYTELSGFMRLSEKGEELVLGNQHSFNTIACGQLGGLELRHLSITHDGDGLVFRKLISDAEVRLTLMPDDGRYEELVVRRMQKLVKLRAIYGGPIAPMSSDAALETLQEVNHLLAEEAYRPHDDRGRPGGVVNLPKPLIPIIVGDLHAQVNNLLTLLAQNNILELLESGDAALILLGDAIHSEQEGKLEEMDDSMLIMDLIFRLKLHFPKQVFYIRGNHDSFSANLTKFGIAQCLLWEAALRKHRGNAYLAEMEKFYASLPYVVISDDFVACHAAPIKTRFDHDGLVNIYRNQELVRELTSNRLRRRTSPAGYAGADVRHFRETLKLSEDLLFFVSHSPLDRESAQWLEAGGIKNHHIVFSANVPWIGVFIKVQHRMIPLSYYREELLPLVSGEA